MSEKIEITQTCEVGEVEITKYSYRAVKDNREIWFDSDGDIIATIDDPREGFEEYIVNIITDFDWLWKMIKERSEE